MSTLSAPRRPISFLWLGPLLLLGLALSIVTGQVLTSDAAAQAQTSPPDPHSDQERGRDLPPPSQGGGQGVGQIAAPDDTKTFYATSDTYVDICTPDNNYSTADVLYVANDFSEFVCDAWLLLDFDLGSYPAGVIFRSASLHLYQHGEYSGEGTKTIGIYAASAAWSGAAVTWNTRPGVFAFLDYGNVSTGAGWREYDVTTVAERWLVQGTANHGFVVKPNTSGSWMRSFRSLNYGSGAPYKAYLVVTYDQPSPTPTATRTATRTATATRTSTPTATATLVPTKTPTATATATRTATPTAKVTDTPTRTPTRTPTTKPTNTPTRTPAPTSTPTPTFTPGGPLAIVAGPSVSAVTQTSALISWTTNKGADSRVRYGRYAALLADSAQEPALVTAHQITLTGLQPATTYAYVVESAAGAERAVSRQRFFKTAPPADASDPSISDFRISRLPGKMERYQLEADVSDDTGVASVEFYMDGALLVTDYSGGATAAFVLAPATLGMAREDFFGVSHQMMARARDLAGRVGNSESPWETHEDTEIVMELSPQGEYNVYVPGWSVPEGRSLTFEVYAEEQDWHCDWRTLDPEGSRDPWLVWDCDANSHAVDYVNFYVDGELMHTSNPSTSGDYSHEYSWSIGSLGLGDYRVRAEAVGRAGGIERREATVRVRRGERMVEMVRTVERHDTFFDVNLEIRNTGTLDIELNRVVENMTGFQPFDIDGSVYTGTLSYSDETKVFSLTFDLFSHDHDYYLLRPGNSVNLHYNAAPVLLPDDAIAHAFGAWSVRVHDYWASFDEWINRPTLATADGASLADAVAAAQAAADYLVVTRPGALFALFEDEAAVHSLLRSMAKLARYRTGVLGFLPSPSPDPDGVRDLIQHWGEPMAGSDGAPGGYHTNGYLVLVGEDEIVTSWDPNFDVSGYDNIARSDMHFANTAGWWVNPEIIVSRIIGNSPAALEASIRNSLAVRAGTSGPGFRRDSALVLAGDGDGWTYFNKNVEEVHDRLDDEFPTVSREKVRNLRDAGQDPVAWFRANAADRNVIFWRDHCGNSSWTDVVDTSNVISVTFGSTYPFAFACCCSAGRYAGITGIAETFTQQRAPVYIGATERSPRDTNNDACLMFFNRWVGSTLSLGQVFRNLKHDLDDSYSNYWSVEYQMYGDPKLGGASLTGASPGVKQPVGDPPTTIAVTVPDYTIEEYGGYHHVTIPGGGALHEPNRPVVPTFTRKEPLPVGYRVQEVTLVSRSAPTTAEGLHLFSGIEEPDAAAAQGDTPAGLADWWPTEPFRWEVEEHPDGTGLLRIHIYPFVYDPATGQARFYKEHTFAVSYTVSNVEIYLAGRSPVGYGAGEEVAADLWVVNTGQPADMVVSATIRPDGPAAAAQEQGLLLQTLAGVQGLAHFPLRWETAGLAAGHYLIQAEVRDLNGDLLDSTVTTVQLGAISAEATGLAVTPGSFGPGDPVSISLAFRNTGAVPISGTAVIQVLSYATHEAIATFQREVGLVASGASAPVSVNWTVPPQGLGTYRIAAYVLYRARSTEPLVAVVRSGRPIYLPLTLR